MRLRNLQNLLNTISRTGLSLLLAGGILTGCSRGKNAYVAPPPQEVQVQAPVIEDAEVFLEFPGTTEAVARAEIRARVKGYLEARKFEPGQFVKAGQVLFTIERGEYEAALTTAKGYLAQAEAKKDVAKTNFERLSQALKSQAVSEIDVLEAEAALKEAEANVEVQEAAVADAIRNLNYTEIKSPVAGRVSKELVDVGNLVGAGDATLLTTVVNDNPTQVNFEISERTILPYLGSRPSEGAPLAESKNYEEKLKLALSDGSEYPIRGSFNFMDNAVNRETGTISARATFANEEGALADGLFVRIGIPIKITGAALVSRAAVLRDLGGDYVMVVGEGEKVERRMVTPTEFSRGADRILKPYDEETGLGVKEGDRVIVSGLQRVRPGIVVVPVEAGSEGDAGGPAPTKPPAAKEAATGKEEGKAGKEKAAN